MSTDHPITPPPKLVGEWLYQDGFPGDPDLPATITITTGRLRNVATQAARWGADQELEACCDQLERWGFPCAENLHNTRRPKPPSLKQRITAAIKDGDERTALLLLNEVMPDDSL